MYFVAGGAKKVKQTPKRVEKRPALEHVPGVRVGLAIEWAHGSVSSELTQNEIEAIKRECGYKTVPVFKATQIKSLMRTKTYVQIVRHFNGKKGYAARTIWGIYAALSQCGGGV